MTIRYAYRPSKAQAMMLTALAQASLGTCARRKVGCVLTDRRFKILATGYNGPPVDRPHCLDTPCAGAAGAATRTDLRNCEAVHAEMNALVQCRHPERLHFCFVTTFPCVTCVSALLNTNVRHVVYRDTYTEPGVTVPARERWLRDRSRSATALAGAPLVALLAAAVDAAGRGDQARLEAAALRF